MSRSHSAARILLCLALTLPVLAGCSVSSPSAPSATQPSVLTSPATSSLASLSDSQAAAMTQELLPSLSLVEDAEAAVAEADELVAQSGLNFGIRGLEARVKEFVNHLRRRLPPLPFHMQPNGGLELGDAGSAHHAVAPAPKIAYDAEKKQFTLTASIEHQRNQRGFTAVNTHIRVFDAAGLAATVDPATIDTAKELKELNLPLLETQHNLKITNAAGTHSVHRIETFTAESITIHMEIVNDKTKSDRQLKIVKDSTIVKATGVETGKSTTTVTQDGKVVKSIESTFTIQHELGTSTVTAEDPKEGLRLTLDTDRQGHKHGRLHRKRPGAGQPEEPAGTIEADESGSGTVTTAAGNQNVTI